MFKILNLLICLLNINTFGVYGEKIFKECALIDTKDVCLNTPFCAWCNISNTTNSSHLHYMLDIYNIYNTDNFNNYSCIFTNTCLQVPDAECIYNMNYLRLCTLGIFLFNFFVVFVFIIAVIIIIEFSNRILIKYAEEDTKIGNIQCLIIALVVIPGIVLWGLGDVNFIYYIFFIIVLSLFLCCSTNSNKLYENHKERNNRLYNTNRNTDEKDKLLN